MSKMNLKKWTNRRASDTACSVGETMLMYFKFENLALGECGAVNWGRCDDDGDVDSFTYTYNERIRQAEEKSGKKKERDPSYNGPDQPKSQAQSAIHNITIGEKQGDGKKDEWENKVRSLLSKASHFVITAISECTWRQPSSIHFC